MRTVLLFIGFAVMSLFALSSCGGGSDDPPPPNEANLAVTTDPANGTVQPPALGPYNLKVTHYFNDASQWRENRNHR